jgi:hypothetical protein
MKHFLLFFLTIFILSCTSSHDRLEQLFSAKKKIYGEVMLTEPNTLAPIEVYVNGTSDLFLTEKSQNYFAAMIKNTNELIRFCPIGKGPNEFFPPLFFSRDKSLHSVSFFAPRVEKFYTFKISINDSIRFNLEKVYSGFKNSNRIVRIQDSLFLSTTAYSSIMQNRYSVHNNSGELLYSDIPFPENNSQGIPNNLKSIAFQCRIASNPNNGLAVSACNFAGHFEILSVDKFHITKIFELHTSDGNFDNLSEGKFLSIKPSRQSKIAYLCVDSTKDYIFLLYSGRTIEKYGKQAAFMGNIIFKFSWSGEPIEQITLDHDVLSFSIVNDNLFAIGLDSIPKLFKYKL